MLVTVRTPYIGLPEGVRRGFRLCFNICEEHFYNTFIKTENWWNNPCREVIRGGFGPKFRMFYSGHENHQINAFIVTNDLQMFNANNTNNCYLDLFLEIFLNYIKSQKSHSRKAIRSGQTGDVLRSIIYYLLSIIDLGPGPWHIFGFTLSVLPWFGRTPSAYEKE